MEKYLGEKSFSAVYGLDVLEHGLEENRIRMGVGTLIASGSEQATSLGAIRTR